MIDVCLPKPRCIHPLKISCLHFQHLNGKKTASYAGFLMENRGFEPLTPALPAQCSTAELIPHEPKILSQQTVVYYVSHENTTSTFKIAYPLARIECLLMGNLRLTFYVLE